MTKEELFKKNFPEYCTEKGVCLSPYYDVFDAGVEIATAALDKGIIQSLIKENAELKETVTKMNNVINETSSNLTKAKDHIKKLLDCLKQATNDPQTNYYVCQYMDKAEQFLFEEVSE